MRLTVMYIQLLLRRFPILKYVNGKPTTSNYDQLKVAWVKY